MHPPHFKHLVALGWGGVGWGGYPAGQGRSETRLANSGPWSKPKLQPLSEEWLLSFFKGKGWGAGKGREAAIKTLPVLQNLEYLLFGHL